MRAKFRNEARSIHARNLVYVNILLSVLFKLNRVRKMTLESGGAGLILLVIQILLLLCVLGGLGYYAVAIYAASRFFKLAQPEGNEFPPITLLKPVCGLDPDGEVNLLSFCQQDYPSYQIIFAVRDRQDPIIPLIKTLIEQFPSLDIDLVVSDRTIGANLKVSNLANARPLAKHPLLLIADSDIRVGTDYLRRVVQPMQDPAVGVVTCLYRSIAHGWVSTLEALSTTTEFHAGVLTERLLGGMSFALGSTILIRTEALEAIGGFEAIANHLADDFLLGNLPTQHNYKVVLSPYVVDHVLGKNSAIDAIKRQIRWARGIRVSRPWGYLGLIFTYGSATSLLFLLMVGGSIGWLLFGVTLLMRLLMAWTVGVRGLQDPIAKRFLWLVPIADICRFLIWGYSFFGNGIEWRGRRFKLVGNSQLQPIVPIDSKI